ncbi:MULTISPECIES: hypothetical protein [unclassified Streptomyces]|uniref:hypothetical protein n=1 Tax=unclassified Streptomyces TaxID=2593676 RepID=UPI0011CDFC96|nr:MULTISPECIES: hypothetical protein [unclassified Streptomyces]TXS71509.1 hypothetical protein EAO69_22195 [Streptomyces sp. me109]
MRVGNGEVQQGGVLGAEFEDVGVFDRADCLVSAFVAAAAPHVLGGPVQFGGLRVQRGQTWCADQDMCGRSPSLRSETEKSSRRAAEVSR